MGVIDEDQLIRLYRDERQSLEELADQFGWSVYIIRNALAKLGVRVRTPWERNAAECSIDEARRLYLDERLSLTAVAARLGVSQGVVRRRLIAGGVARREDGGVLRYTRTDFSGSLTEKAYLIGFRIGDLHVSRRGDVTVLVKCTTTRSEQIDLFHELFDKYGHVYTDEAHLAHRRRQSIAMEARLNLTFEFLLLKQDAVPEWILESDETFFAFMAGYIDAEGYFRAYLPTNQFHLAGRLEIRTYDFGLLSQLSEGLNSRGIICPAVRLRVAAGYVNGHDVRSNRDLWGLGVHRRDSLRALITRLEPFIKHPRRRIDMMSVWNLVR